MIYRLLRGFVDKGRVVQTSVDPTRSVKDLLHERLKSQKYKEDKAWSPRIVYKLPNSTILENEMNAKEQFT